MKKTIFAIVIISIFAFNGLALAKTAPSKTASSEDLWFAINELRNQVASLQAELKAGKGQVSQETMTVDTQIKKSTKEKNVSEKRDTNTSRSEHYIMKDFSLP